MSCKELSEPQSLSGRRSFELPLLAEYARMLLVVNCAFVVTILAVSPTTDRMPWLAGATACWLAMRVAVLRWRWYLPWITLALLVVALNLSASERPVAAVAPLSAAWRVTMVMLLLIGFADANAIAQSVARIVSQPNHADRLRSFLLRHGLRILISGVLSAVFVYAVAIPSVEKVIFHRQPPPEHPQRALDRLSLPMNIWFRFSESLSAIFFFVLGACVGSFLNVVIYRLPHRISVLVKPSHCPGCKSEISFRDNRPVLGWLKLQGRCRDCNVSIPMRYPTIELLIGLVFLLLFFVELISGGTNLPARTPKHAGVLWILFYTKWDLVGLYLYHCFLFCTLFSWVMIGFDGHRLPRLFVVLTMVFFAGLQFCFPGLQLLQGHLPISGWSPDIHSTIALTCGLGLAGGLIAGLIAGRLQARSNPEAAFRLLPAWMLLGIALGWQAVAGVFVLLLVWRTLSVVHRAFLEDGSAYEFVPARLDLAVPVFFLLHHCVWRLIWLAFPETPTGT